MIEVPNNFKSLRLTTTKTTSRVKLSEKALAKKVCFQAKDLGQEHIQTVFHAHEQIPPKSSCTWAPHLQSDLDLETCLRQDLLDGRSSWWSLHLLALWTKPSMQGSPGSFETIGKEKSGKCWNNFKTFQTITNALGNPSLNEGCITWKLLQCILPFSFAPLGCGTLTVAFGTILVRPPSTKESPQAPKKTIIITNIPDRRTKKQKVTAKSREKPWYLKIWESTSHPWKYPLPSLTSLAWLAKQAVLLQRQTSTKVTPSWVAKPGQNNSKFNGAKTKKNPKDHLYVVGLGP